METGCRCNSPRRHTRQQHQQSGTQMRAINKQQAASPGTRPLMFSCSPQHSTSSTSSDGSQKSRRHNGHQTSPLNSACRQIAELKLNSATKKKSKSKRSKKLLGSKSLSLLMPRAFFSRNNRANGPAADSSKPPPVPARPTNLMRTTKSFPNGAYQMDHHDQHQYQQHQQHHLSVHQAASNETPEYTNNHLSVLMDFNQRLPQCLDVSMIGLPRQSTERNSLGFHSLGEISSISGNSQCSNIMKGLNGSHLSPIVVVNTKTQAQPGSQNEMIRNIVASTPMLRMRPSKESNKQLDVQVADNDLDEMKTEDDGMPTNKPPGPFKSTALVLRDVKNSIGLRMKARHESKAFARLTNELATPNAKLAGPKSDVLDRTKAKAAQSQNRTKDSSKRTAKNKLKSGKSKTNERVNKPSEPECSPQATAATTQDDSGLDCSVTTATRCNQSDERNNEKNDSSLDKTPKNRIALRHKKHLLHANTFAAFDSPAGRLRETVKDVEQFQQCIEDISAAIRARGQPQLI